MVGWLCVGVRAVLGAGPLFPAMRDKIPRSTHTAVRGLAPVAYVDPPIGLRDVLPQRCTYICMYSCAAYHCSFISTMVQIVHGILGRYYLHVQ